MDIILTHERTDFDGLASLLGAHLLDETLVPVLPRQLNRNVEAFLMLYGLELPFIDPRDLKGDPIHSACLVDTQGLTSIKGMVEDLKVRVIDHHPLRGDIPDTWEADIRDTGSATTIFVEAIQERDLPLTPIQATLLLLGIYEDTGSLTYTRTKPADIFAAGFLLEQGASLEIVADYLNHPLSMEQQQVYEDLRANAESHIVHGHSVIIAQADASDLEAELSSLAHKLRDLLDPDAIFLLLTTSGGIQMIARSTDDHIDVAAVLSQFEGGGGHPRAAAALVQGQDLSQLYNQLIKLLPQYVQPAVRAKDLMSRDPQTLAPDTPVQEAAELMVKFGYEGYPVVDDGEVVGLLTRRAVDRALSHDLNLTASKLMEAGKVQVFPSDSLEHIQDVMVESSWGQVPVVSSRSKRIVGIVTRTDLLKILAPGKPSPGRQNLGPRLEASLPSPRLELLKKTAEMSADQKTALYIVGGFVRDLLLDVPSLDFDLVVEGDAIQLAKRIQAEYGGRLTTHKRFGTAKWFLDWESLGEFGTTEELRNSLPESLDFISARREFYSHPTALPTVERSSIKLDLHRRDFTINTLALRLDGRHYGEVFDYWGGLADLKQKKVRVLHSLSFVDDPTRILRAVRYEQRYDFEIGERTLELLLAAKEVLNRVSGDRIRHELNRILEEKKADAMMNRLGNLTILEAIHPDLEWNKEISDLIHEAPEKVIPEEWGIEKEGYGIPYRRLLTYLLWLMRTPRPRQAADRLKLPGDVRELILGAAKLDRMLPDFRDLTPSSAVRTLERIPNLAIYAVYLRTGKTGLKGVLSRYLSSWQHVESTINGADLQEMGLTPGPLFSELLTRLRSARLDGEVDSDQGEQELLEGLLKERGIEY